MPEETPRKTVTYDWPTGPGNLPGKQYHKTVTLHEFKEEGSYIGLLNSRQAKRRPTFLYAPMNVDGTVDLQMVGTIDNVDDDEKFVAKLNAFFGTDATIHDFPGR